MKLFSIVSSCVVLALALGCNKAADEQKKADEARASADDKIIEANQEATDKIKAARTEAEQKVAEAQANFAKLREDFRHDVTQDLVTVDKRISDLEAKAKSATGKAKAELEPALPDIRAMRETVASEYRSLELASALTWDDAKGRVNKAVDDLKKAIDKVD